MDPPDGHCSHPALSSGPCDYQRATNCPGILACQEAYASKVESELETLLGRKPTTMNLVGAGDSMLLLVKKFLTDGLSAIQKTKQNHSFHRPAPSFRPINGSGMHMPEQIDRNTGALRSAKDLTWSYANVLKACHARKQLETMELALEI